MLPIRLYLYAAALAALLTAGMWYRHTLIMEGEAKVVAADMIAADKQREAVAAAEKKWAIQLADARTQHDAEVASVLAPFPTHRVVCHNAPDPRPVPGTQGVPGGASSTAAVVPEDPGLHPDIGPALGLLARRADKLAADARELNALTH